MKLVIKTLWEILKIISELLLVVVIVGISAFLFCQLPEFIHLIIFGTTLALGGISLVLIAYQKAREKMKSDE